MLDGKGKSASRLADAGKSSPKTEDALTEIWERVLERAGIDAEDDFFELGGNRTSAYGLCAEISRVFARDLPPVLLCQVPTIQGLAAVLQNPAPAQLPTIILLKPGLSGPAAFMVPGWGDSVLELSELAREISFPGPIYGIQAPGFDGVSKPLDRVEDIAEYCLAGLRQIQPHGPYLLTGYSMGGLIALEMAQRLMRIGDEVGLLAMVDSYPNVRSMSLALRGRMVVLMARLRGRTFTKRWLRRLRSQTSLPPRPVHDLQLPGSMGAIWENAKESTGRALHRYRPKFYAGEVRFIRAQVTTAFPNPKTVWSRLTSDLQVDAVPGTHISMLKKNYRDVAKLISRYLTEAVAPQTKRHRPQPGKPADRAYVFSKNRA